MRPKSNQNKSTSSLSGGTDDPITAENYVERARAFVRAKGDDGEGFVIRAYEGERGSLETEEPATPAQWSAWMAYFEAKRIAYRVARKRGMTTVPAEWPHQFDPGWPFNAPPPIDPPRAKPYVPDWRNKELVEMMQAAAGLSTPQGRRRGPDARDAKGTTPDERLEALRASYAAEPTTMSPELAKRLSP